MTEGRYFAIFSVLLLLSGYAATSATAEDLPPVCPRVDEACTQQRACHYKFKIIKDNNGTLKVQYPESVFSVTCKKYKNSKDETDYKKAEKDKPRDITVRTGAKPEEKQTYAFERCADASDSAYVMGKKLSENDETPNEGDTGKDCDS